MIVGIPILNRPDLLRLCLGCLPRDVRVLIIDNSVRAGVSEQVASIAEDFHAQRMPQGRNIGVAASWNLILRTAFAAGERDVFIGSTDSFLGAGDLNRALDFARGQRSVGITHLLNWNFFLMPRQLFQEVGLFDENFHPAYMEDTDYAYRCKCAGVSRSHVSGIGAEHIGSATIRSDRKYATRCRFTKRLSNAAYYRNKWGGMPGNERFTRPFNGADLDYSWWPPPGDRVERNDWERQDFFPFTSRRPRGAEEGHNS